MTLTPLPQPPASAHSDALAKLENQIRQLDQQVDALFSDLEPSPQPDSVPKPDSVKIWGVPFSYLGLGDTLVHIDQRIASGQPGYFITANLNYCMLTERHPELRAVNDRAAFILCDGMPIVLRSRFESRPLPERVAGSELIYALTKFAAHRRYRIFFLGGGPGVAEKASHNLQQRYPGFEIAGLEAPDFRTITDTEEHALLERIRASRPDIVYVALGQPKGEMWIAQHFQQIGAPATVQLGASFDFVAGGVPRAPRWIQKCSIEWFYRFYQEPRRLGPRYVRNGLFLAKAICRDLFFKRHWNR